MLVDTHCHLDFPEFDQDRDQVIRRAKDSGIEYIVNIGSGLAASQKSCELAQSYGFIYAACGIHPHDADKVDEKMLGALKLLAKREKVVAIGETGLDYYKNYSRPQNQRQLFVSLVELAKDAGLPLVIHSRSAGQEILGILRSFLPVRAVIHCFSGDADFLKECLELGFFVSFTCNITYKKAEDLRGLVKVAPLERLMLETDAPFLSPEGFRGKRNEPARVEELARQIAMIKEISFEETAR
ncbi:MAG: TatD family hydrolase, partial [Candidatus Omnitrophica bacterium]|nr:TatD family hydrolase [Candidatus Omnitrophota bacterium]